MRITPYGADHVEFTFSDEEMERMEAKDWATLNDFALLIQDYNRWKSDCRKIKTKELLANK